MTSLPFTINTHIYHHYGSSPIQLDTACDSKAWTESKNRRTLVFFHAGGLICGNRNLLFPEFAIQLLLRKGWLVITADYHLLPESGVADIIEDIKRLEEWILGEGKGLGVDLGQMAVAGASAGSFVSVLALSTWKKIQPRAFYSLYGMLDVTDPWYSIAKGEDAVLGGFRTADYQEENIRHFLEPGLPALWDDQSAITDPKGRIAYFLWLLKEGKLGPMVGTSLKAAIGTENLLDLIAPSFPPTVAVHGTADTITPLTDSRKLIQGLKSKGVQSQMIEVEGANHGLNPGETFAADLENSVDILERMYAENVP